MSASSPWPGSTPLATGEMYSSTETAPAGTPRRPGCPSAAEQPGAPLVRSTPGTNRGYREDQRREGLAVVQVRL